MELILTDSHSLLSFNACAIHTQIYGAQCIETKNFMERLTFFPTPMVGMSARTPRWLASPKPAKKNISENIDKHRIAYITNICVLFPAKKEERTNTPALSIYLGDVRCRFHQPLATVIPHPAKSDKKESELATGLWLCTLYAMEDHNHDKRLAKYHL